MEIPLESLDLSLEALLGWIKLTLAALSNAEKASDKFSGDFSRLAFFTKVLRLLSRFLLRALRTLSFRIFLIADLIKGMFGMIT